MNDARIDEIRKRVEKATKGPWRYQFVEPRAHVAELHLRPYLRLLIDHREDLSDPTNDYEFFAHSRADIEYLLAALQAARAGAVEECAKEMEARISILQSRNPRGIGTDIRVLEADNLLEIIRRLLSPSAAEGARECKHEWEPVFHPTAGGSASFCRKCQGSKP